MCRATCRDRGELGVVYRQRMRVRLEAPGEFHLWHGSSPDIPPRRRESLNPELTPPAANATFRTAFLPPRE